MSKKNPNLLMVIIPSKSLNMARMNMKDEKPAKK